MISRFFIDRPIFASVVSIVMTLIGAIALFTLPIAQYPRITPPGVSISISYPGANAQIVADTVAAPIEQQVNGVPGMLYMSSQMGNDGSYSLTVTFDIGVDLNTALVMVQNRVTLAMPQLPSQVQKQGITIRKRTPDILMIVNLYSPGGTYDDIYLSNYATINLRDELLRVQGVSDVTYQGQRDYSIRIWLDPQKLAARSMTALDVASAIRDQNIDAPAGQVGQQPAPQGQIYQLPIDTVGWLTDPEEFANIIVKVSQTTAPGQATGSARSVVGNIGVPAAPAAAASAGRATSSTTTTGSSGGGAAAPNSVTRGGGASSTATVGASMGANSTSGSTTSLPSLGVSSSGGGSAAGGGTTAGGGAAGGGGSSTSSSAGSSTAAANSSNSTASPDDGSINGISINSTAGAGAASGGTGTGGPGQPSLAIVRVRDVGTVELGAQNYNQSCLFDGKPSVGLAVYQLPGTNALDVAKNVQTKMEELKTRFPDDVDYAIAYDTTPFIRESVADVERTLFIAVMLVAAVVLAFLQNWRSVIIPLIAVPVAIISTFAVMAVLGFSLNNISLFGLVLAIGIVVDDAIVVVENVERWLEHGLNSRDATIKAMGEVTGPIIAVALVLCAVFVPCAFVGGITGQFFRQFAVTISASTIFSTINSLTLSPALAAILLKPHHGRRDPLTWVLDLVLGWFFKLFNILFGVGTSAYSWIIGRMMRFSLVVILAYGVLLVITFVMFDSAPIGFVPQQDQGRLICSIQLPDSASLQRTKEALKLAADIATHADGVAHTVGIAGLSFVMQATSPNYASMFIVLKPFAERKNLPDTVIMAKLRKQWAKEVKDAIVTVYGASPVPGLGVAGGFKAMIEDRGGLGLPALQKQTDDLVRKLQTDVPGLVGVTTQFRSKVPQLMMQIDRVKAASLGVSLTDVNQTLEILLGSLYVNSFNQFGRHWQVTVQAAGEFRNQTSDVNLFQVRNNRGQMVPLGTLVNLQEINGPISVTRYNLYQSAAITGNMQPGYSSGAAIGQVDEIAAESLPLSMKADWTELMYMQKRAGNTSMYVFALAVVSVFLALAALYESWSLPLAVILVVPLCLLSSVIGVLGTHRDVNIFVQIGLIVLVGLACKNAILIVEFARQLHEDEGRERFAATQEASRLRLRPILMTSFAFIFGVAPLVVATGAGAEMRRSLGTAVFSGMLGVTLFGIFLTPVFFYVIQGLGESKLMTEERTRWFGSVFAGGALGFTVGFLLGQLGVFKGKMATTVSAAVGAAVGISIALVFMEVRRRMKAEPAKSDVHKNREREMAIKS